MVKILKPTIAFLLAVSLGTATVVCCCVAPAVMAHFHKTAVACSHCPSSGTSHGHSSNPTDSCMFRVGHAEAFQGQVIMPVPIVSTHIVLFDKHVVTPFLASSILVYPRGSPPLTSSFTPLYLRTFTLRI